MIKIVLILVGILFINGCNATYSLSYVDGVIREHIEINDFVDDGDGQGEPGISEYIDGDIYFDVNNLKTFEVNVDKKFNGKYDMSFDAVYDTISYEDAVVLNECVEFYEYFEDDEKIYIAAYGEYYCYGFDNLSINLKTDKKVSYSNHDEEVDGKYVWNYEYGDMIDVELEINKNEKGEYSFWFLKYILWFALVGIAVVSLLIFGVKFYRKYQDNREV